jgi:hypothetical protein
MREERRMMAEGRRGTLISAGVCRREKKRVGENREIRMDEEGKMERKKYLSRNTIVITGCVVPACLFLAMGFMDCTQWKMAVVLLTLGVSA